MCVCVCVCACMRVCVCMYVCMYVCEEKIMYAECSIQCHADIIIMVTFETGQSGCYRKMTLIIIEDSKL